MQCKDIEESPILEFLAGLRWEDGLPRTGTWFPGFEGSVQNAMPPGVPEKLVLAKMKMMIRKRLLDGCVCGCRGDFRLTEKGRSVFETAIAPPFPPAGMGTWPCGS